LDGDAHDTDKMPATAAACQMGHGGAR
jgi:hypothetical protein